MKIKPVPYKNPICGLRDRKKCQTGGIRSQKTRRSMTRNQQFLQAQQVKLDALLGQC